MTFAQKMLDERRLGYAEGYKEGELKKAKEIAVSLAALGLPGEQIAAAVKTSIQSV